MLNVRGQSEVNLLCAHGRRIGPDPEPHRAVLLLSHVASCHEPPPPASSSLDPEEQLARFREEWKAEVRQRKLAQGGDAGITQPQLTDSTVTKGKDREPAVHVTRVFDEAHAKGFKFSLGGDVDHNPTNGLYLPVSIVDNPPDDSRLVCDEQFAPIVPLLKWRDEQDVVRRASM